MLIETFPYSNIMVGILIFIVGFIFHWIGQLISVVNWDYATKIGLQEKNMPKEFKVYEKATATADAIIGWSYGIVAIGLILNTSWAYELAWIPGAIFVYHSFSYWFYIGNQNKIGMSSTSNQFRIMWFLLNLITGILATLTAW